MKLDYLRLKNFIGIYLGMGIYEIEIPFFEGKNKICMLLGANGSGKSTILDNAIPQPYAVGTDRDKVIIDGVDGEKEIWYTRGSVKYKLLILYKWNKSKESHSTKAFITRIEPNGTETELNPNGNVTSYKDILEMEFMLDPAFMKLCKLSQESINICKMKTTERKTVVSSLLEEAEAYIAYGKKVNDKCRYIENNIKNVSSKINKIGDINSININLERVNNLINETHINLDNIKHNKSITENNMSKINLSEYNINKEKQSRLQKIINEEKEYMESLMSEDEISNIVGELSVENFKVKEVQMDANLKFVEEDIKSKETKIHQLRTDLETTITELKINEANRDKVKSDRLPEEIRKSIAIYENQLRDIDSKLDGVEVVYDSDKIIKIQDLVLSINKQIDNNLTYLPKSMLEPLLVSFEKGQCISLKIHCDKQYEIAVATEKSVINRQMPEINALIYKLENQKEIRERLKDRPSTCKIDTCAFITEALGIPDNIDDLLIEARLKRDKIQKKYENARDMQSVYSETSKIAEQFQNIYGILKENRDLLEDAPENWNFTVRAFVERIKHNMIFSDPALDLNGHLLIASLNERYNDIVENIIPRLKKELEFAEQTEIILKKYVDDIESCNTKMKTYEKQIDLLDTELEKLYATKTYVEEMTVDISNYFSSWQKYSLAVSEMEELKREETQYEDDLIKIQNYKEDITTYNRQIQLYENQLNQLNKERDTLSFDYQSYYEYAEEKSKLEQMYVIHEKIRYALSTRTGIPLIFLDMYLNKTRIYANSILEELFGDEYKLCEFEIDATEFKIPCEVRGEYVTDVSLMSSGERAILSLVISLTLMYQASSSGSYDIITLDEMDAVLDSGNRNRFISALEKLMEIFGIQQILSVSHNDGFESYPIDLVLLRDYVLENRANKNIIYKFK